MTEKDKIVLSIVEDVLGDHRRTREDNPQKYFNCRSKKCMNDKDKYNLSYNAEEKIFKCWKCEIMGSIYSLIKMFGDNQDYEKLKLILPNIDRKISFFSKPKIDFESIICELPKEYKPLWIEQDSFKYKNALKYVMETRKISMKQIQFYKIGYTEEGDRKLRIIIPSYNIKGKINYYEARAYYDKLKQSYMKPNYPDKDDIIFNEKHINWDLPIILVEGIFDAIRMPNSIPILGKHIPSLLLSKILDYNPKIILCLDEDALSKSEQIYNTLSSLGMEVYFIDMQGMGDVSKVYEEHGNDGIVKIMSKIRRLDFEYFISKKIGL